MYGYSRLEKHNDIVAFELSDNMSINGTPVNEIVDGYRQLSVSGRGLVGQEVKTTSIAGRRGVWIEEISEPSRVLEIKYQLEAKTSEELREKFDKLNLFLRTTNSSNLLEVTFKDEPNFTYFAIFNGADNFEENSKSIVSRFSLLVPDGYKKSRLKESVGQIELTGAFEVMPEKIVVTTTKTTNTVRVTNGRQTISFTGAYDVNQDITILFETNEVKALYKGRSILSELDLFSDLENFKVRNLDTVSATNARVKEVKWRDERR
jgi:putative phage tail component, N-terminal domain protein|uniref:Receptor binding protein n=1 Tax=Siphoviridae sp. ctOow3 TaxID=2826315 RepID=A0A8S5QZM2_9CAUD|nr:MAG TPA: Receptor binding protein [Siphoviridae sp. ctOow3]